MSVVRDNEGSPADGPEVFGRKVARVPEAGMLSQKSEWLLATGSVRIERPAVVVRARAPAHLRRVAGRRGQHVPRTLL